MLTARVYVTLKPAVNDPQGQTVLGGLHSLGYEAVADVRIGKYLGRVDILVLSLRHGKLGTDILPMGQNPHLPPQPLRPLRRL